ncbi:DUF2201 family putative metallopeptidase [Actinomadura rupiterrae]|uniref:DUF2201 family putative metallopeptidase n=1 Tax=Actinomadura rupiterrae TaxID=559627 RepID=UPI0020A375E1|nr:hypothetical protein [Actinomadura rupiterrae]MCP2340597.1 hypothetical protein [Actinomadura rupiterrae]
MTDGGTTRKLAPIEGRVDARLTDLRRLMAEEPADPDIVAEARKRKESALLDFGIAQSSVASWLYAKCHHHIPTTAVPTAAVLATGDGSRALLYNPHFFLELDQEGVKFVLFHEARHLMHRHLYVDEELRSDPRFTLAAEVAINHVALLRLRRDSLPTIPGKDGGPPEPTGIDPRKIHAMYEEDLRKQGLQPLPYDEFCYTDLTVYGELRRMKSLEPPPMAYCVHGDDDEIPLDPETVEQVADEVLREVVQAALRGNQSAREEVLNLADRSADGGERIQRMWGGLGLEKLRGVTPVTRRVEWWQRWLVDVLASKLEDAERLVYPKKHGAILLALGHDPMLTRRGPERKKVVLIALDTSGSMPDAVISWLTTLVGQTDGVESHWLSFDGVVMPFVPGERVLGGGGTNFQNVVDYAEGRLEVAGKRLMVEPDAIIMVTDGYARKVSPAEPDKWIWLITDNGDDWPDRHHPPMACHRVTSSG